MNVVTKSSPLCLSPASMAQGATGLPGGASDSGSDTVVDPAGLRRALGAFPTGVTVVCTLDAQGAPVGFTANSFTSVSLDPPLVLVCLAHTASSHTAFAASSRFAVSVLSATQEPVARVFATRGADRFAETAWRAERTGAPVMDGAAAWFDCALHERVAAGDHDILIGRVQAFGRQDAAPLAYAAGRFARLGSAMRLLGLAHSEGRALFRETADGLRLPQAEALGPPSDAVSLSGVIGAHSRGLRALQPALAFDGPGGDATVYAAAAEGFSASAGWRVAPVDAAVAAMACPHEARAVEAVLARLG